MNFKNLSLFIISIAFISNLISSCSSEISKTDSVFDDNLPLNKRLKLIFEKNLTSNLGINTELEAALQSFYKARNYKPVWADNKKLLRKGLKLKSLCLQPNSIGIPTNRLRKKVAGTIHNELIVKELLLTANLSQIYADLNTGFMDTSVNALKPVLPCETAVLNRLVKQIDTVQNWSTWFAKMGPNHLSYKGIAIGLFKRTFGKSISSKSFKIPEFKKDSLTCTRLAIESLIEKRYMLSSDRSYETFQNALKLFQIDNGMKDDAKIGKYTLTALEESEQQKVDRSILSLERWRWRSKFPDRYIWINIPEYLLRIYYNDTLFSEHKVVVGKNDTRTPQLTSKLRSIMAMPYWTQPQSIASKEFLPSMQNNPGYAARNHYKIYRGDVEVDPYSINWKRYKEKNFPFKVRQEPGEDNSLGIIKFEFNNKYGVYVHDTPSKGFFNRDIRSYSHGCVRCQNPDSLARFILRRDEKQVMIPDSLDSLLARKQHYPIILRKSIPLQIDYITVVANAENKLIFYPDIYKRDADYIKWMNAEPLK